MRCLRLLGFLGVLVGCAPALRQAHPPAPAPKALVAPVAPSPRAAATPTDGTVVRPCVADSPEAKRAAASLEALGARIEKLAPAADPKPIAAELAVVLGGPCLALLGSARDDLSFDSSFALRTFWRDGGAAWAKHVLELDETDLGGPHAWFAPTPRKTLTLEAAPKHPLAPFLFCEESDATCGAETEPWRRRAHTFFELFDHLREASSSDAIRGDVVEACKQVGLAAPANERFVAWRQCLDRTRPSQTMLPLGKSRAPKEGWLIVRGRRGHYAFCDEVRAYDLATGAAHVVASCSNLVLREGGSVDGAKTNRARVPQSTAGRVGVDAVREAAWTMMLAGEAQKKVRGGFGVHIPDEVDVVMPEGGDPIAGLGLSFTMSSGQTTLAWSWVVRGSAVASGTLTWPKDYNDPAREHAVRTLEIAELGMKEGCAPASPPARLATGNTASPAVSALDADPASVAATQNELQRALARLATSRRCAAPSP